MVHKIVPTAQFWVGYFDSLDYVSEKLKNMQARLAIEKDADRCIGYLKRSAESFKLMDDEDYREREYRSIHLDHHKYRIIFKLEGNDVVLIAFLNDLQDVEKTLG